MKMATMMASGHAMSVLANNCIKSPVDNRFGRIIKDQSSHSINGQDERKGINVKFSPTPSNKEYGVYSRSEHATNDVESTEDLSSYLKSLTDEEFYERLHQMKEQQKKTLEKCEQLYMEKRALEEKYAYADNGVFQNEDVEIDTGTMIVNGLIRGENYAMGNQRTYQTIDNVSDLASKPPAGPSPLRPPSRQGKRPITTAYSKVRTKSHDDWTSSMWSDLRKSKSFDGDTRDLADFEDEMSSDEELGAYLSNDNIEIDQDRVLRRTNQSTPSKLELEKIESMWDDFTVNDYIPRERPSSAPATRRTEKQKKASAWRHRLTIPQPFNMTLREETKEKKKTAAQIQAEEERLKREQEEEIECQKKFKAKPVPAHIYLPLYDEINEKNEARRKYVREYCKDLLKSQEKPFEFMKREQRKLNQRRNSEPTISPSKIKSKKSPKFKAKPVPSFVYSDSVARKQVEDEEYRKLRITMRSEELLKEASLPPSMAAREKVKEQKIQEIKRQARARKKFKPKVQKRIPDYDGLYKKFQQELCRRKKDIEPTVVEPFSLETSRMHDNTEKVLRDIARDEEVLLENRWPYRTPRARTPTRTPRTHATFSSAVDTIPAKMTRAAETRNSSIRKSLEKQSEERKHEIESERRRRAREYKLSKTITEKAGVMPQVDRSIRERLRKFKESERMREEQYQSEIDAIKERVDQQPLLFERQRQVNAKNKAEKRFANTLRNVGLDEEFVYSKSSAAPSLHGDENDDYDQNDTYVKSSEHYTDSFEED